MNQPTYECDACHRPCAKIYETLVKVGADWLCMAFCRECFKKIGYESPEEYRDRLIAEARKHEDKKP